MQKQIEKGSSFSRLIHFAGKKRWHITGSIIAASIGTILGFIPFVAIYLITIALLTPPIQESYVWFLAGILIAAAIGKVIIMYISLLLSHLAAFDTLFGIKHDLIKKIGVLPLGFMNNRTSGAVRKIITEDVDRIELFIAHHLPDSVSGVVLPILAVGFMFTIDWRLALIALIPIPLAIYAMNRAFTDTRTRSMKQYYDALEKMNGTIVEFIRGMPVVKVFNQTTRSFSRLSEAVYTYRDYVNAWTAEMVPSYVVFTVCTNLPLLFILPAGLWFLLTGSLTIPEMVLFLILGTGYTSSMVKMATFSGIWRQIIEGIDRIDDILDQPEMAIPPLTRQPENYTIRFDHVTFAYGNGRPAIENISFTASEGTVTALVGPSGSGKSTIAQLIPRFWDAGCGTISIGGVDIRQIPPESLMDIIAFVFQDAFLFHETIEENIRMGRPEKTFDEIIAAAKAAQAHEFIMALPQGYQTTIGSDGTYLSGGEQQRIVLARAICKNSPIVILDEATAFADPENEYRIQQAITSLLKGRTVIMIAHRLSTISRADQILVMERGRICESGTHGDLLSLSGLYSRMWQSHAAARTWRFSTGGGA